jgi:hypothetical protein
MKQVKNVALVSCLAYSLTLKMDVICFSETSVEFQRNIRRYISEWDSSLSFLFAIHDHCNVWYVTACLNMKPRPTREGSRRICVNLWMSLSVARTFSFLWKQRWIVVNYGTVYTAWLCIRSGNGGRRLAVQTLYETQYITLWLNAIGDDVEDRATINGSCMSLTSTKGS